MSNVIERTSEFTTIAKVEDGKFNAHTTFHDDESLNQNDRIRSSGMLDKGKLGLHDKEDIRFVFSCPSVFQWNLFKKRHFETYQLLISKAEYLRMKGAKQLQILHPDWCVMDRK